RGASAAGCAAGDEDGKRAVSGTPGRREVRGSQGWPDGGGGTGACRARGGGCHVRELRQRAPFPPGGQGCSAQAKQQTRLHSMKAEILSVGTELLLGQIVDTNANYLAQQLPTLGLDLFYISQVGDNLQRLADAFRRGLERSDVIISTGGVGPTEDDLTREAIAEVFGEKLEVQPELERQLREFFVRRGRTMPERNVKQATTIRSGTFMPNPIGTAPGWWVQRDGKVIISMPGVPHEMRKMWEEQAQPRLARLVSGGVIVSRTLKLAGIGESHAEEAVGELTHSNNPTLATYAKSDGIPLRLTAKAHTTSQAAALLDAFEPLVHARVQEWLYGTEGDDFPGVVGKLLRQQNLKLAVAESATGGQLAALITESSGASDYFLAGYVAYSRAAKEAL